MQLVRTELKQQIFSHSFSSLRPLISLEHPQQVEMTDNVKANGALRIM